jgi:hypothetical protein
MRRMSSVLVCAALLAAAGVGCGIGAWREPSAGPGSWLSSLAGDWTVELGSAFVIGNDPQRGGTFTVYRVSNASDSEGHPQLVTRAEIKEVLECASDGNRILLKRREGYEWRSNIESGALGGGWHTATGDSLPAELGYLRERLAPPRASRRLTLGVMGSVLLLGALVLVVAALRRAHTTSATPGMPRTG